MTASRFLVSAPIVSHENVIGAEFTLTLHAPEIAAARPGQFVELVYGDGRPLLRRPFSLFQVDRAAGTCSVFYRVHGEFTTGLSALKIGEKISVLGPLGKPFSWDETTPCHHILIAGGIGAPPLHFLATELSGLPVKPAVLVLNGARTEELLVGMKEFGSLDVELIAVTEDGTQARTGLVTEILTELLDAENAYGLPVRIYACGPMPMLRAVGDIAVERGVACQISVETSMPCGFGLCQGCAVRVRTAAATEGWGYALACVDGPVFEASALVWK